MTSALQPLKRRLPCTPWAARMHRDPSHEKCIIGGVGSGKSHAVSEEFIIDILRWPQTQSLIMLGTYKQIREGALKTLGGRLNKIVGPQKTIGRAFFGAGRARQRPEPPGWSMNLTDFSITILRGPAAGHRIVVWSAEAYESLKSAEFDRIWCDEVQTWEKGQDAYAFVQGRLRPSPIAVDAYADLDQNGEPIPGTSRAPMRMWLSANPPWTTAHWLYQRFVENRDPDDTMSFYHVKTDDNTLLPNKEAYKARLRRNMAPDVYRIEVLGEWGDIGVGRAYTTFVRTRATSPSDELPSLLRDDRGNLIRSRSGVPRIALDPDRPLIWSQDFGVQPRASVVMQLHVLPRAIKGFQDELIYVLDAIEIPNGSTDLMIKEFARRYPPWYRDAKGMPRRRKLRVFGDPAGRTSNSTTGESDWAYMEQSKTLQQYDITYFHDGDASPFVIDRVNATNAKLCNADDEVGMLFDPGDGQEDKAAAPALTDFQQTHWKKGTRLLDKGSPARGIFHTHLSDATAYFIVKKYPQLLTSAGARVVGSGATSR